MGKLILFLSSYSPLFALAGVRTEDVAVAMVFYAVAAVGVGGFGLVIALAKRVSERDRMLVKVEDRGHEVAGYLATYLFPFLTVSEPSARDLVAYGGFIAVVAVVYVRSTLVAVNPLAYCFGFRLFACTVQADDQLWLLSKRQPIAGDLIRVRPVLSGLSVSA